MEIYDTAIVLGSGVNDDGSITQLSKTRIDKALTLYHTKQVKKLVVTGGFTNKNTQSSEAESMFSYALKNGVHEADIIVENMARNTVENAYYVKINIIEPHNWKRNIVVTNEYHIIRSRYLFSTIFGRKYVFKYIFTGSKLSLTKLIKKLFKEVYFFYMCWRLLRGVKNGDNEALAARIKKMDIVRGAR